MATLLPVFFTAGCFPKSVKQELPKNIPKEWSFSPKLSDLPVTASLLDLLDDPKLKSLVKKALENNHDLKATALRLKGSQYLLLQTQSRRLPSVNGNFTRSRDNQSMDTLTGRTVKKNHYRASVNVSWELDIWGKLTDEHHAKLTRHEVKKFDYIYAYDSLAARVIQSWISISGAKETLDIQYERVRLLETIEKIILRRYTEGLGTLDELFTARSRSNVAKADISRLNETYRRNIRSLKLLQGNYPVSNELSEYRLPEIALPPFVSPMEVLLRRPDIQAALANVESEKLAAVAAQKNRLPSFSLSYESAKKSNSLSSLRGSDVLWNLIGSITQPLFEGNRLVSEARAAELSADASLETLIESLLTAVKEVEDRTGIEIDLLNQETLMKTALEEAGKSTSFYRNRYQNGLESLINLLTAVEQEMAVKERLTDIRSQRMINRIDLALALGMGS